MKIARSGRAMPIRNKKRSQRKSATVTVRTTAKRTALSVNRRTRTGRKRTITQKIAGGANTHGCKNADAH